MLELTNQFTEPNETGWNMNELEKTLSNHLKFIYGKENGNKLLYRVLKRLSTFQSQYPDLALTSPTDRVNEGDSILITYGDQIQASGKTPLKALSLFLNKFVGDAISTIHILPFFPYSSDDGFSVMDYFRVNPECGSWEDIEELNSKFRLMFDAVINHISSKSVWFQGFLSGDPKFEEFFTVMEPGTDLSRVFRPRATPLLTPFETSLGKKFVWTTFSADQVDLNYANPDVLLEVIDILLFFAAHGADFIRLDAVTFLWKEYGTPCINLPQTHRLIQAIRTIFDIAAPKIIIITETNVPHEENVAYFGDGQNEAQMVYNFALPILTLNSFHTQDVSILSDWVLSLTLPSKQNAFLNFLAGHDGIGVLPVKNILAKDQISAVIDKTKRLGGFVSYKTNEDGTKSPYELNINYLDALNNPDNPETENELIAKRFLAAQSIMLALKGIPGIYIHSLLGSHNWREGVQITGRYRTINREKFELNQLEEELKDIQSLRHLIFNGFHHMLNTRKSSSAFHPFADQKVLSIHSKIFALERTSLDGGTKVICLVNISNETIELTTELNEYLQDKCDVFIDFLNNQTFACADNWHSITLEPYQVRWLESH
jgi:glycosidase